MVLILGLSTEVEEILPNILDQVDSIAVQDQIHINEALQVVVVER